MSSSNAHVLLLYGGTWSERDVSLKSAVQVAQWLKDAGIKVLPVRWDADGWKSASLDDLESESEPREPWELLHEYSKSGVEVVFNCLHGGPGEDGSVAAWLDMFKMAYTGSGVIGGAVSACKISFRQRVKGMGFKVPQAAVIHQDYWERDSHQVLEQIRGNIPAPWVVKDPTGGSSDGVVVVQRPRELQQQISSVLKRLPLVLVEQFLVGQELSVPCLGMRQGILPQVLQTIEICLPSGVPFDRQVKDSGKYVDPELQELCSLDLKCPAGIDPDLQLELSRAVKQIHMELDLGTCSRTDLILCEDDEFYFLETNTCPGMTERSLVPYSARVSGIESSELVRRMIDGAISQHLRRWNTGGAVDH
ncbi:hypothetical protein CBD41_00195 [bacterium TMED181]|nr:hypothetical protein [Planctomycetota bacterium]OUW47826.1 MAG: hypothetical protein CBD41_00195 [bacterium TMED181]